MFFCKLIEIDTVVLEKTFVKVQTDLTDRWIKKAHLHSGELNKNQFVKELVKNLHRLHGKVGFKQEKQSQASSHFKLKSEN